MKKTWFWGHFGWITWGWVDPLLLVCRGWMLLCVFGSQYSLFFSHLKFCWFTCKAFNCLVPPCFSELLHPNTPSCWWLRSVDQLLLAVPVHVRQTCSLFQFVSKVFFKQTSYFNIFCFLWIRHVYRQFLSYLCGQFILSLFHRILVF